MKVSGVFWGNTSCLLSVPQSLGWAGHWSFEMRRRLGVRAATQEVSRFVHEYDLNYINLYIIYDIHIYTVIF